MCEQWCDEQILTKKRLHVVAAVIYNDKHEIFLAKRSSYVEQGGLWEFPGGKLRSHETGLEALKRELNEELGIILTRAQPLIKIQHNYPDKHVLLDVWKVHQYEGEPYGREGQVIRWVKIKDLYKYNFPAANLAILKAVHLPHHYWITEDLPEKAQFDVMIKNASSREDEVFVQFNGANFSWAQYQKKAQQFKKLLDEISAKLIIAHAQASIEQLLELLKKSKADGLLLSIQQLQELNERPIAAQQWFAAEINQLEQAQKVQQLDCDFLIISPIRKLEDAESVGLGWNGLQALTDEIDIPVYAAGGVQLSDLDRARGVGAQGLALPLE